MNFGTVGSPLSTPRQPGGSIGAIQRIHELNLNALELGWVRSVNVSEEKCELIKQESEQEDVKISVHAPYFINLNADEDEWINSRKRLMTAAYYGNLAGATDIIFHPGSYFNQSPAVVLRKVLPRLQGCVEELRRNGNPVVLRPETMGKAAMLGSLEDTIFMSENIPGIYPCLDFAHLHARQGDGSFNTEKEWMETLDQYQKHLGLESLQNLHIHLSGIEYTAKGEKNHLPIRESDFNVPALLKVLKHNKCDGRIVCESPILEEDACYLRDLWEQTI